jgi:hypothetical protein
MGGGAEITRQGGLLEAALTQRRKRCDFRFGSKAEVAPGLLDVRFAPWIGHLPARAAGPFRAKRRDSANLRRRQDLPAGRRQLRKGCRRRWLPS